MRIKCPWCGPRPLNEFTYGGDATTPRPEGTGDLEDIGDADLADWMDHVYLRDNPAGRHKEYWHHVSGCRSWLVVTRDTTNHKIESVTLATPTEETRPASRGQVE